MIILRITWKQKKLSSTYNFGTDRISQQPCLRPFCASVIHIFWCLNTQNACTDVDKRSDTKKHPASLDRCVCIYQERFYEYMINSVVAVSASY